MSLRESLGRNETNEGFHITPLRESLGLSQWRNGDGIFDFVTGAPSRDTKFQLFGQISEMWSRKTGDYFSGLIFWFRVTWRRNKVKPQNLEIPSQPSSACQSFRKFVHYFLSVVSSIARCPIIWFRVTWPRYQVKNQNFEPFTAIITLTNIFETS